MCLIIKGIAVGFSIAAPVGAIGFLCIEQTLRGGFYMGLFSGLGAASADMCYGILVALGLKTLQTLLLSYKFALNAFGGLFLCYLGIVKFFSKKTSEQSNLLSNGFLAAYIGTFFLTLTNPGTILDFIALFTGLNIDFSGTLNSLGFVGGVFLGSAFWWLLLCFSISLFKQKVSTKTLKIINYIAGAVLFSFGFYALMALFK